MYVGPSMAHLEDNDAILPEDASEFWVGSGFLDTGHEKRIFPHGRSESFFQFQVPGPRSNNTLELEYIGIY